MAGAVKLWNGTADRVRKTFLDYQSERETWAKEAANDEDFFSGRQWTKSEIKQLKKRGMAPIVVNRTLPVIMQEVSILTAKRPSFRYYARDDSDTQIASMWSDVAAYIWDQSRGDVQWQQSVLDMFKTGAGYLQVYIDSYADDGRGEVYFKSLPVYDVYADPNAREIDLSDARSIIVSRVVTKDSLKFAYPDLARQIGRATPEHGPITDRPDSNPRTEGAGIQASDYDFMSSLGDGEKTRIYEMYEKVRIPYYKIMSPLTGSVRTVPADTVEESLIPDTEEVVTVYRTQIRLTVTAGNNVTLYQGMLPTRHYPIIPLFLHHERNPFPRGDVSVIKGMQQEINKRRSIMIHNATLAGNYRVLAEEGQIANESEFEESGSTPGFILKWRNTGSNQPPREMLPQTLPNAFIQLESEAKQDLEYAVSVFGHMMGSNQDAPETYRGLLALEEAGQQKIRHKALHANLALKHLGRVVYDFARYTYQEPKLIRITGEDNEDYRDLWLNKPTLDPVTGEPKMVNSVSVGDHDLVVVDGSSMPTNRMALLNLYLEMFQLGIVDKTEVLKKTDVVNKEAVLERMGEIAQLTGQVEQLGEALKNEQGLNQTMRRQLQQSEINQEVQKGSEQIREEVQETEMAQKLQRARMQDELGLLRKQSQMAVAEARLDANILTAKAKMEAFLEKEKAKMEAKKANSSKEAK